ncbi:MAG: Rab family GTPase [Candidatus Hodarchaeales archaeon]
MSENSEDITHKYKIILAGDGSVGKTTLINRFVTGRFNSDYKATIGVDIFSKRFKVNEKSINLQIWDIAGQSLFRNFRKKFYSQARGALLVFDLTLPSSLESLGHWIEDIVEVTGSIPLILIGNKSDLTKLRTVTDDEISNFLDTHNIEKHFLTSALTGDNVEDAFVSLVSCII